MLFQTRSAALLLPLTLTVSATLLAPRPTAACGTMVFASHAERPGGMNGQELFLSVMPEATTMVISASFIDVAGDKAFLLPLADLPTQVLDADESLFIALEAGTTPVVSIHDATEDSSSPSIGCAKSGDGGFARGTSEVELLDRGSTQTYDYVIVGGDTGAALADWLDTEGFGVPAEFEAALDVYASAGWYFLAARPTAAAAASGRVAPLELSLPGSPGPGPVSVPFGIGAFALAPSDTIDLTLYVASPTTLLPSNYAVAPVDADALEATSATSSNYVELFDALVEEAPTWVVEYSYAAWGPGDLDNWALGDFELGVVVEEPVDEVWLDEFGARLGYESVRLTRLRTRLSGEQLVDLTLESAADIDVDRAYYVTWDPAGGCGVVDSSPLGGLGLLGFGLGLCGLLRRRRALG